MKTINVITSFLFCLFLFSCKKNSTNADQEPNENPLQKGLLAFYPFNGNSRDESGNGYHLSVKGAVLDKNRFNEMNRAYTFNGISDYMVIPKLLKADSLRELTISMWVKSDELSFGTFLSLLSKNAELCSYSLGFNNDETSYSTWHKMIYKLDPGCTTSSIFDAIGNPLNTWRHIVLVQQYIRENTIFPKYSYIQYYDGQKLKGASSDIGFEPSPVYFTQGGIIGGNNNSGNYDFNFDFFKGAIDDIRIYDRTFSDGEVLQLFNLQQ